MSAQYAEFKEKNEKDITDDPDETILIENKCTNDIDQE